jgi:hypothetical protein
MQAQAKVPRGRESGPTCQEGEQNLRPQRERITISVETATHAKQVVGDEQPSPSRMGEGQWEPTKVNGPAQSDPAPAYRWWHQGNDRRPKAEKASVAESLVHKPQARHQVLPRLADQVVVAMTPRDNITLAERRTCGVAVCSTMRGSTRHAFGPTGRSDRVAEASTYGASNSADGPLRKGASDENVRSRHLQAVLGKTRRTEFQ